jgi:hypothetical protein
MLEQFTNAIKELFNKSLGLVVEKPYLGAVALMSIVFTVLFYYATAELFALLPATRALITSIFVVVIIPISGAIIRTAGKTFDDPPVVAVLAKEDVPRTVIVPKNASVILSSSNEPLVDRYRNP